MTIEYLIYFIELLDDIIFKNLLEFIYEKDYFIIEPFKTYKEFFLYLLINEKSEEKYKTEITYEELAIAKNEVIEILNDKKQIDLNSCKNNKYYLLKSEYEKVNKLNKNIIKQDDIKDLLNFYNNKFISTYNADSCILQYIKAIALSIKYFFNDKEYTKGKFKKFLNYIVNQNINEKCCYGIYKYNYNNRNDLFLIQETKLYSISNTMHTVVENFYIIMDNNQIFITDMYKQHKVHFNNFVDLYNRANADIKYYKNLIKAIKVAVKKLNTRLEKGDYCHICNPYDNPEKKVSKQKCQNCQKIYALIMKIDSNQTTNSIGGRIKRRVQEEKHLSCKAKKDRHYKNLIEFVQKLEKVQKHDESLRNVNTSFNTEKFNQLYSLIDKTFGKNTK